MKSVLILLIVLSLGGGSIAIIKSNEITTQHYFMLTLTIVINLLCAKYLYSKASHKKVEWALFGFLGNINSLFIFWLWSYYTGQWKKGNTIFGKGFE